MDSIYSNLTQYTVTVDNVLYPYIQRTDIGLFCLICQKPLSNINHHVNSKNHTKKLKDRRLLKTVKYYHDQFLCLSSSQQMEQIYFVPEEVTCLLCTAYCHTSANVIIHISEEGHRKLVQKREKTYETNSRGKFSSGYPYLCIFKYFQST